MSVTHLESISSGFDGASLKVERAYGHINELQAVIQGVSGNPANALSVTKQPNGFQRISFASIDGPGRFIPLIMGDAIHNLRSAYDHLWLALHRTTGKRDKPSFPFSETRKNLEDTFGKSAVKQAFPDVERLIFDEIKPHRDAGGNELIWAITHFDNIDKHNLIIPTFNIHRVQNMTMVVGRGNIIKIPDAMVGMGSLLETDMPFEYQCQGPVTLDVTIPEDYPLGGQSVIPTLANMAQATVEVVALFRKTFL